MNATHSNTRIRPGTVKATFATSDQPGPVAVIQLHGDVETGLASITGIERWPIGSVLHVSICGIDRGIAVRLTNDRGLLMPHGGPRIRRELLRTFRNAGIVISHRSENHAGFFPDAADHVEALALAASARAASPLAIDLLLNQPRRWRECGIDAPITREDRERARRLNHLLNPPLVTVVGRPNVGKSTLTNRLSGRAVSITADAPGTTRDYTSTLINLAGLVVTWIDTAGMRATNDAIESHAVALASQMIDGADLLIAMTDPGSDWPALPRLPDLRLASKSDLGRRPDADLSISAVTGAGLVHLVHEIREMLVRTADLNHPGPWLFDPSLAERRDACKNETGRSSPTSPR